MKKMIRLTFVVVNDPSLPHQLTSHLLSVRKLTLPRLCVTGQVHLLKSFKVAGASVTADFFLIQRHHHQRSRLEV
jgi:hypothetical protein